MRKVVARLALSGLVLVSSPALAKKPIQVLVVQSDDAVPQAQALTEALKSAIDRTHSFQLAEGDFPFEVMTLALGCADPPDAECLGKIGKKSHASAFVWGTAKKEDGKIVAEIHLWQKDDREGAVKIHFKESMSDSADPALKELAYRAFASLIRGEPALGEKSTPPPPTDAHGQEAFGKLLVLADDVDGELIVDGRPATRIQGGSAVLA